MRNVTTPRIVSFEDALRNLATKLTGTPADKLPRTQEAVVQYMAENVPSVDEMAEAITQEVMARLASATPAADEEPPADPSDPEELATDPGTGTVEEPPAEETKSGKKGRTNK